MQRHKQWREDNAQRIKEEWQAYWPVRGRARLKLYLATPKGKAVRRAITLKRRSRCVTTDITSDWLAALLAAAVHCPQCKIVLRVDGKYPDGKHIDHIKPLALGGPHMMSNVRVICAKCNLTKNKYYDENKEAA